MEELNLHLRRALLAALSHSPPSSGRVQSGLGKFFGPGSQKRGAEKPVSEEPGTSEKAKAQQISAGCHEGKE